MTDPGRLRGNRPGVRHIAAEIRAFLGRAFRARLALTPIEDDTPLFSSGILDSFAVLELIAFLEETFKIEIDTTRHELTDFDTVRRITAVVESFQDGRGKK